MAVINPGQFSLKHTRSVQDSLDLIMKDGVFKNFTLDNRRRLQYNTSRWSQRAVVNKLNDEFRSVNPLPTVYRNGVAWNWNHHECTIDLRDFPNNGEAWIPITPIPNISDHGMLTICISDEYDTGIYTSYNAYHENIPLKTDAPSIQTFVTGIVLRPDGISDIVSYSQSLESYKIELGYTYVDGRYLIHVAYLDLDKSSIKGYYPGGLAPISQYNSINRNINIFDTRYFTRFYGEEKLVLSSKIRGYQSVEDKIILHDDSINYGDEFVSLPKEELLRTDIVEYVSGDISVLGELPDGFELILMSYYDESTDIDRYSEMINDILGQEYYVRSIMMSDILSADIITTMINILENSEYDNSPNISFIALSHDDISLTDKFILVGDDLYDSSGNVLMNPMDVFYFIIEEMDSGHQYENVIVKHNYAGIHLISSIDTSAQIISKPQVENYHYNADELDPFLLQLYIGTFHACINKYREEIISGTDKEQIIKDALSFYNAPDAYDFTVVTSDESISIECKVDYKKKIEVININLNLIING